MPTDSPLAGVAHVIQLSVAPVFLLTAVVAMLNVLSTRLGRIVDRSRVLVDRAEGVAPVQRPPLDAELALLVRRRTLINLAITCSTLSALWVAAVMATAFLGFIVNWQVSGAVAVLFMLAMAFFVGALLLFLREVMVAASVPMLRSH
jgi:hypothetical protein